MIANTSAAARPIAAPPPARASWFSLSPAWSYGAIVALAVAFWLPRLSGPIDLRYDGSVYYVLGTALAEGGGYRILSEPGAPEAVQYPPLLPAIVAVHQRLLGTNDPAVVAPRLRWTYAALFVVYAIAMLRLARTHLPPGVALFAAVLCVGQVHTYLLSDMLFTELPFALCCVAFVLVLSARRRRARPVARETLAFGLAASAFLLRSAGIAVLAAWVGEAVLRRRWRLAALRAVLAALPFLAWQGYVARVQSDRAYDEPAYAYQRASYQFYNVPYAENMSLVDPFRPERGRVDAADVGRRIVANLGAIASGLGESVSASNGFWRWLARLEPENNENRNTFSHQAARAPLFVLTAFVLGGGWLLVRRRDWPLVLLIAFSVTLVCTTPWPGQVQRYLAPLTPFLTLAFGLGVWRGLVRLRTGEKERARWGRWALVGLCGGMLVVQAFAARMAFVQRDRDAKRFAAAGRPAAPKWFYHDQTWIELAQATEWIAARAARDEVVALTSPHLFYLQTGLRAVMPPMERDPAEARRLLDSAEVAWLVVDSLEFLDVARVYARPAVESAPGEWQLARRFGETRIFRRTHGPVTAEEEVR